jgi:hypothetical protein
MGNVVGVSVRQLWRLGGLRPSDKSHHLVAVDVDRKQGIPATAFHRRLNRRSACLPLLLGWHHVV